MGEAVDEVKELEDHDYASVDEDAVAVTGAAEVAAGERKLLPSKSVTRLFWGLAHGTHR